MANLTLVFDEYPDDEIVLRISPVPMGDYFDIIELYDGAMETSDLTKVRALFDRFAPVALVSWSFPEPATAEGLYRRDFKLASALVAQWLKGVRDVPRPLPLMSSDGTASMRETSPSPSSEPS